MAACRQKERIRMKSITINESEITTRFGACKSLSQVISSLEDEFNKQGQVVCEVTVNGVTLDESDESRFAEAKFEDIKTISLKVSGIGDLLDESLNALFSYIPEMIRVSLLTADRFRAEEAELGTKSLSAIIQGSSWL